VLYSKGKGGVARADSEAVRWWEAAAKQGEVIRSYAELVVALTRLCYLSLCVSRCTIVNIIIVITNINIVIIIIIIIIIIVIIIITVIYRHHYHHCRCRVKVRAQYSLAVMYHTGRGSVGGRVVSSPSSSKSSSASSTKSSTTTSASARDDVKAFKHMQDAADQVRSTHLFSKASISLYPPAHLFISVKPPTPSTPPATTTNTLYSIGPFEGAVQRRFDVRARKGHGGFGATGGEMAEKGSRAGVAYYGRDGAFSCCCMLAIRLAMSAQPSPPSLVFCSLSSSASPFPITTTFILIATTTTFSISIITPRVWPLRSLR
jgi:hypothetical protein